MDGEDRPAVEMLPTMIRNAEGKPKKGAASCLSQDIAEAIRRPTSSPRSASIACSSPA